MMNDSLVELVVSGAVAPEEALTKTSDRGVLVGMLRQAGFEL